MHLNKIANNNNIDIDMHPFIYIDDTNSIYLSYTSIVIYIDYLQFCLPISEI